MKFVGCCHREFTVSVGHAKYGSDISCTQYSGAKYIPVQEGSTIRKAPKRNEIDKRSRPKPMWAD